MREYLKELRKQNNVTQTMLAEFLGISQCYYCAIENGTRMENLNLQYLKKLSEFFNVPLSQLISDELQTKEKGA